MPTVTGPTGDLCANIEHTFELTDAANCASVQWMTIQVPSGVALSDVIFNSPNALVTDVIVPAEGRYRFGVRCCEIV